MSKKILVVEDEPDLLLMMQYGLEKDGYEVFECLDGRTAPALTARIMPDLLILDLGLPGMDGDELVRLFRNDEKLKDIPVILVSSMSGQLSEKAAACGVEAYLEKPFAFSDLSGMVKRMIERPAAPR